VRVAHVITRLIVGGAQENTVYSVLGMARKPGLEVLLISGVSDAAEGTLKPLLTGSKCQVIELPSLVRPISPALDWQAYRELVALFKKLNPQIVHTHSGKAGIIGRMAAAKAGVPIIVHTIHGPSFGSFQGPVANWIFTAAERRAARVTTHFVVVANAMRDQYLRKGIGAPDKYTLVRSGFDLDPFLTATNDPGIRKRLGLKPDDFVVGKIARLVDLKGHEDLVAVAPSLVINHPGIKFLLVGDGNLRAGMEEKIRQLRLSSHFVFTGLVDPTAVPALIGVMDMVIHLSQREGLARALPQALAAGKPVVAYDCDGAGEVCLDGRTGFLVPADNRKLLVEAVSKLAANPELRKKLGETGRGLVRSQFSIPAMVDGQYALYRSLVKDSDGEAEPHPP
jgi:glycosyltransferase involved in cell wall biosynthesis